MNGRGIAAFYVGLPTPMPIGSMTGNADEVIETLFECKVDNTCFIKLS